MIRFVLHLCQEQYLNGIADGTVIKPNTSNSCLNTRVQFVCLSFFFLVYHLLLLLYSLKYTLCTFKGRLCVLYLQLFKLHQILKSIVYINTLVQYSIKLLEYSFNFTRNELLESQLCFVFVFTFYAI